MLLASVSKGCCFNMNFLEKIRALAKTTYYQTLYKEAGPLHLQLFNNSKDLTYLQIIFLNYLNFYQILIEETASKDISPEVLKDVIYEDAYMTYRRESAVEKKKDKEPSTDKKRERPLKPGARKDSWSIQMRKGKMKKTVGES